MQESTALELRPGERLRNVLTSRAFMVVVLVLLLIGFIIAAQVKGVTANSLLSLFVRGTLLGGTLALGAVGVTLVFAVLKMANFAHGDTMTFGAYLGLLVIMLLPKGPPLAPFSFGYEFLLALVIIVPLIGLLTFGLDQLLFRPLRKRRSQPIMFAMAALGLAFGLRGCALVLRLLRLTSRGSAPATASTSLAFDGGDILIGRGNYPDDGAHAGRLALGENPPSQDAASAGR